MKMLTTKEAAAILQLDASRVRLLAAQGRLRGAQKIGRDWVIPESAARAYAQTERRAGRPKAMPRHGD
jgi:excisionase family DNA binding protein